jgi:hypothetical protein
VTSVDRAAAAAAVSGAWPATGAAAETDDDDDATTGQATTMRAIALARPAIFDFRTGCPSSTGA